MATALLDALRSSQDLRFAGMPVMAPWYRSKLLDLFAIVDKPGKTYFSVASTAGDVHRVCIPSHCKHRMFNGGRVPVAGNSGHAGDVEGLKLSPVLKRCTQSRSAHLPDTIQKTIKNMMSVEPLGRCQYTIEKMRIVLPVTWL